MQNIFNKKISIFILGVFLLFNFSHAEKVSDLKATDYVNDYTGTLTQDEIINLSQQLFTLEKSTGDQVAVFLINSMEGDNGRADYIEHFAVKLYEQLGLSTPDKQKGVLFLISKNDRQLRIEVGYGLEATLTDGIAKNIIDNSVTPEFKKGNYSEGISKGVEDITTVLNGGNILENKNNSDTIFNSNSDWLGILIFIFVVGVNILAWLGAIMARTKSWWLGGVVGGVFGGIIYFLFLSSLASILGIGLWVFMAIIGTLLDYFISKNYKYHLSNLNSKGPGFWSGGTWGPGSGGFSGRSGSGFGGFGGGGFSGGGGSSGSW